MVAPDGPGFDPSTPGRRFHAVLLDIDHTPRKVLRAGNAALYGPAGLAHLANSLLPGGVFALWSDDPPDPEFRAALESVFETAHAHVVTFPNPLTESESSNTVYFAVRERKD